VCTDQIFTAAEKTPKNNLPGEKKLQLLQIVICQYDINTTTAKHFMTIIGS